MAVITADMKSWLSMTTADMEISLSQQAWSEVRQVDNLERVIR